MTVAEFVCMVSIFCIVLLQFVIAMTIILYSETSINRATQRQFSENICSKDDLRSRIFGTFVVKYLACLPLLGFSNVYKMV